MREMKLKRGCLAGILAVLLLAAGFRLPFLYAANEIDTSKTCSLTLEVPKQGSFREELLKIPLHAKLYRVAMAEKAGKYTATEEFRTLQIEQLVLGEGDWEKAAEEAALLAEKQEPDAVLEIENGTGTAKELKTGMYLVLVEPGYTLQHAYTFSPYMIALPDNRYHHSQNPADDYWQYEVTGGLKPEQSPRYGSLKIQKTLKSYNTALGDVTFVFQIEGTDPEGNVVYSNVVSTTHDAAGTKEAVVEHLPAGTTVTVTEVYSGASYRLETEPEQTAVIAADEMAAVKFSNAYDEELTPGYGVTNHFEYDEEDGWRWIQEKDNSTKKE